VAQNSWRHGSIAAFLGLFALGFAPANADVPGRPDPADVAKIDACLADAARATTDLDACIGRISSACAETATTTAAREECSDRELLVWNGALTHDYARLTAMVADATAKQALRDAQRDFIVSKLKKCTFERLARKDSPEALVAAARCDVRATARQDLWLREQIESLEPH